MRVRAVVHTLLSEKACVRKLALTPALSPKERESGGAASLRSFTVCLSARRIAPLLRGADGAARRPCHGRQQEQVCAPS